MTDQGLTGERTAGWRGQRTTLCREKSIPQGHIAPEPQNSDSLAERRRPGFSAPAYSSIRSIWRPIRSFTYLIHSPRLSATCWKNRANVIFSTAKPVIS